MSMKLILLSHDCSLTVHWITVCFYNYILYLKQALWQKTNHCPSLFWVQVTEAAPTSCCSKRTTALPGQLTEVGILLYSSSLGWAACLLNHGSVVQAKPRVILHCEIHLNPHCFLTVKHNKSMLHSNMINQHFRDLQYNPFQLGKGDLSRYTLIFYQKKKK